MEILLYGIVGSWENETALIVQQILEAKKSGEEVVLRVNSPGGNADDAAAISSVIREHGNVVCVIDGIAYSAAFNIAISCNSIRANNRSMVMLHNAAIYGFSGHSRAFQEGADLLTAYDTALVVEVALKTGKSEEEIRSMFFDFSENFMSAQEALDFGLIDEVLGGSSEAASGEEKPEEIEEKEELEVPEDVEIMSYNDVFEFYKEKYSTKSESVLKRLFSSDKKKKEGAKQDFIREFTVLNQKLKSQVSKKEKEITVLNEQLKEAKILFERAQAEKSRPYSSGDNQPDNKKFESDHFSDEVESLNRFNRN